jgi:hypothetical protein
LTMLDSNSLLIAKHFMASDSQCILLFSLFGTAFFSSRCYCLQSTFVLISR